MAEGMKIPVFLVIKNGTILKNIFLNNPQWVSDEECASADREDGPILIGRHPDCHIVLDHPSISRFHLEVRARPASLKLSVTDRSSVHGTWVSGNRIQPDTPIDLTEGDTVKLGASTRVYSLLWIPLSSAFETEDPLPAVREDTEELTHQIENPNEEISSVLLLKSHTFPMEGENRTPEKNVNAIKAQTERTVTPSSLLSRRSKSKSVSVLRIQTGRERSCDRAAEVTESSSAVTEPDKTGCKALLTELSAVTEPGKTNCKAFLTELEEDEEEEEEEEEETFASDKENMTPLSSTDQKPKRNCIEMQATLNPFALLSLEDVLNVDKNSLEETQEESFCSDKENWTPEAPFHCPTEKSPLRNGNAVNYMQKSADEGNMDAQTMPSQCEEQHKEGEKKQWNMVVDVDCLLNEESRKSLQLLEGLKGTHLIIPRIVIRELDCLKRHESILFRKERKAATSALQWIEECMEKCSWWIHVQSVYETTPVPATPPATPQSQFGDLMDIASPTAEDHILDCALLFKRIQAGKELILVSDSIALKIKAMAEGLICETAKEFHSSLVDPYSKRFLWSGSSPRGSTWSCLDEAVLIESYYRQFPGARKMEKPMDEVKGLRLILLHSSHYGNLDRQI